MLSLLLVLTWLSLASAQSSLNVSERFMGFSQTVTVTTIKQVHFTTTVTVQAICAVPVNVTGVCRQRRGKFVDGPEYLTFNDDISDEVDRLISPSAVDPIQTTKLPSNGIEMNVKMDRVPSKAVLESSMGPPKGSRTIFRPISGLFTSIISFIRTGTVVVTLTQMVTTIVPSTILNSFFILNCTPSPFPFSVCQPSVHLSGCVKGLGGCAA